jgi:hypothetical protein
MCSLQANMTIRTLAGTDLTVEEILDATGAESDGFQDLVYKAMISLDKFLEERARP